MYFVTFGILLVAGVLGAANVIVAKKPEASELLEKLSPYQGYVGAVMFAWGVWDTISVVLNIGWYLKWSKIGLIIALVVCVVELGLGFLLGYNLIVKYVMGKNKEALEKGKMVREKLAKFQGPLGMASIALAVVFIVTRFVF